MEDLKGKNFSVLFTEKDREINKPERELQAALGTVPAMMKIISCINREIKFGLQANLFI